MLIAIGGHAGSGRKIGALDFGAAAAEFNEDRNHAATGTTTCSNAPANEFRRQAGTIFVMGENRWREEEEWPLARARSVRYYLHAGGTLTERQPENASRPTATSTIPPILCPPSADRSAAMRVKLPAGPRDQRPVEARPDVLVYSTPPAGEDLEVTGPVTADLFVGSSAVDTDFTAKLVDVWPDGFAQNLTDGIVRARYRQSPADAHVAKARRGVQADDRSGRTSNVFKRGHRLRLEISSSNFPRFDRNLNTGKNDAGEQTAFVRGDEYGPSRPRHPSALILPVVAR